jgi:outer membrane receptor for ferrienterochelin and colicin
LFRRSQTVKAIFGNQILLFSFTHYMLMKLIGVGCLFLLHSSVSFSQKYTLNGFVTDTKSGERLIGASVLINNKNIGTTTNAFGFYSITLPADSLELKVSFTGYTTHIETIKLDADKKLNIALPNTKQLDEVVVKGIRKGAIQQRSQMSSIDLPIQTIKSLPAFLGEVDILKAIQLLPGVQAGSEGSNGIYVRGGGPDQNLILLDGVPVYNVSHLFGFFSVFNADALNSVEVIKGGFPARYGGRLSSVIDLRMKEGNKNEFHGEGGIGLIASRLTLEGPIGKKKNTSFIISGRRTYADIFMRPLSKASSGGEQTVGYFFYDLNAKINHRISDKDHIYFSGYFGNDKFDSKDDYEYGGQRTQAKSALKWGNATAVVRWNHVFNPKLFGNLTGHYSRYLFDVSSDEKSNSSSSNERFLLRYYSGIRDWSARYDLDYLPSPNHFIKAGASITWHQYKPGAVQSKVNAGSINEDITVKYRFINTKEYDAYIEDDILLTKKLKANIGLHWAGFNVDNDFFSSIQPRLSTRYLLSPQLSLKASYASMNQFIHLLTNSGLGLPTDLWVPVTAKVPPQRASQWAAGIAYNSKTDFEVSVEGYYKTMKNVIEYAEGASYVNATSNWEDKVEVGNGKSYGSELFIQKKKGKTTGMLGYTLSWTNRQFANLNNGKSFPVKYDRRHDFKVAMVHKINKRFEISADWIFGTGQAISLPVEVYVDINGNEVEVFDGRNGFRMKPYHRLDFSAKFSKQKRKYERAWVVSIYNVYNRLNPFYIFRDFDKNTNLPVFKQVSLFPIIPSVSYQFKF